MTLKILILIVLIVDTVYTAKQIKSNKELGKLYKEEMEISNKATEKIEEHIVLLKEYLRK